MSYIIPKSAATVPKCTNERSQGVDARPWAATSCVGDGPTMQRGPHGAAAWLTFRSRRARGQQPSNEARSGCGGFRSVGRWPSRSYWSTSPNAPKTGLWVLSRSPVRRGCLTNYDRGATRSCPSMRAHRPSTALHSVFHDPPQYVVNESSWRHRSVVDAQFSRSQPRLIQFSLDLEAKLLGGDMTLWQSPQLQHVKTKWSGQPQHRGDYNMNIGLLLGGDISDKTIASTLSSAKHAVYALNTDESPTQSVPALETLIATSPLRRNALIATVSASPLPMQMIFVSSHTALPSGKAWVPWQDDQLHGTFDPSSESFGAANARRDERDFLLACSTLNWTILRPAIVETKHSCNALGTQWFVERVLDRGIVCLPDDDEQPYKHISVHDLARAVLAIVGRPEAFGHVLNVCSDGILTPSLHARLVARALNVVPSIQYVPARDWDSAGLQRPMAGLRGHALLEPSRLLLRLGWNPTPPGRFVTNLARDLSQQPRRLDLRARSLEIALLESTTLNQKRISSNPVETWVLRTAGNFLDDMILAPRFGSAQKWKTIAVGLGEEVHRVADYLNSNGLQRNLAAPMIVECRSGRKRLRKLVFGSIARDSVDDPTRSIELTSKTGAEAFFGLPLARLINSLPATLPEGPAWILGRGMEALLAFRLLRELRREAQLFGTHEETSEQLSLPCIEALPARVAMRPCLIINFSGAEILERACVGSLGDNGILLTPFQGSPALGRGRTTIRLVDHPDTNSLRRALRYLSKWHVREHHGSLVFRLEANGISQSRVLRPFVYPIIALEDLG